TLTSVSDSSVERMTTQTSPVRTGTGLPWPALLTLGGATLVMVTAEMLPTALLLPMSAGLGVCCRRTSWTDVAGPPATSCTTRSCSGSNAPTTGADANAPSASSPQSN